MATNVTLNGVSYSIPAVGESAWGASLSSYLVATATGFLSKSGGSFALTADVDFGASYGLKAAYFSSRTLGSTAGTFRLANNTSVGWRNAANSGNLELKVNASDQLEFNGNVITTLALGAANTVLKVNSGGTATEYGLLANANIDASAAIAFSKLASLTAAYILVGNASNVPTAVAVTGDISISNTGVTAISSGVIVDADINASAAIAFSKLASLTSGYILVGNGSNVPTATAVSGDISISNAGVVAISSGVIVDGDINASAAITRSKIASGTADHVVINNGSGVLSSEATLAKSRGGTGADNSSVTFPASGVIVTEAGTQTLSNKTLALPYVTTASDFENLGAPPSNPASGVNRLYFLSGALQYRDSAGTVTTIGTGLSSLNGETGSTQTFAVGTSGTDFNISSATNTHTFNIPDASASARGLVTTGTQTIAGAKTFSGALTLSGGVSGNVAFDTDTLFVDSVNNRVGIGTAAPLYKFSTLATGVETVGFDAVSGYAGLVFRHSGTNAYRDGTINASNLLLQTNSGGRVGIGTTSPGAKLDVAGSGLFSGNITSSAVSPTFEFVETDDSNNGYHMNVNGGDWKLLRRIAAGPTFINYLNVSSTGAVTLGPSSSSSTSLQHVFNLPNANSYSSVSSTDVNSLRISSSGANGHVVISARNTTNNQFGLGFVAGTADTNSASDMYWQIIENDNTNHATLTNDAYRWYNGGGSIIASATRAGAWTLGPSSGNVLHTLNGRYGFTRVNNSQTGTVNALTYTSTLTGLVAAITTLNGITSTTDGTVLYLVNESGGSITINNNSGSASANDRIQTIGASAKTLANNEMAQFIYTGSRWKLINL